MDDYADAGTDVHRNAIRRYSDSYLYINVDGDAYGDQHGDSGFYTGTHAYGDLDGHVNASTYGDPYLNPCRDSHADCGRARDLNADADCNIFA